MSLLLDALKRAEQGKQPDAPEPAAATDTGAATSTLSLVEPAPAASPVALTPSQAEALPTPPPFETVPVPEAAAPIIPQEPAAPRQMPPAEMLRAGTPAPAPLPPPIPAPPAAECREPAPDPARAVFAAIGRYHRRRVQLMLVNGVLLLLVLAVGWYWYYQAQMSTVAYPSAPVVPEVEMAATVAAAGTSPAAAVLASAPEAKKPARRAARTEAAATAPASAQAEILPPPPATEPQTPESARQPSAAPLLTVVAGAHQTDPVQSRLLAAYQAYTTGDYIGAARGWRDVLAQRPEQRDAFLGLAALAVREGDEAAARDYYQRILARNPLDSVAQAGLASLGGESADLTARESRIKVLLARDPQSAHLHFSLGSILVAQQRWADAQQAFFDALRLDRGNPDYAFNLAISLDRLSQYPAALRHYRMALDLAGEKPAGFSRATAQQRIDALAAQPGETK